MSGLRILLVVESAAGGTGRHVADLAAGLLDRGHRLVIAYSPERAEEGLFAGLEGRSGCVLHTLDMRREPGFHDLGHLRQLRALINEHGHFDVVHAHSSKAGGLARLALWLRSDRPRCVYTPHAFVSLNDRQRLKGRVYGTIEKFLARRTDSIICVSDFERDHALELGIPAERLCVVPNGIDARPQTALRSYRREALGLAPESICIGTVGRLSDQKSVDRLISAFAMLDLHDRDVHLLIVGDGPDRSSLEDQAQKLGVRHRVKFLGAVNGFDHMAAMDVFALSSLYEAFPYVLLEAAANQLPVVMTQTGGVGMIVRHNENGLVSMQGDREGLAANLGALIRDAALRDRLGRESGRIASEYSIRRMVDETLAVYTATDQPSDEGEDQ